MLKEALTLLKEIVSSTRYFILSIYYILVFITAFNQLEYVYTYCCSFSKSYSGAFKKEQTLCLKNIKKTPQ